jgi:hypothetical protein
MEVETVTTSDRSLLAGVRSTLAEGSDSLLCVAFAHPRGVHLLGKEFAHAKTVRLLATTTFDHTGGAALSVATGLGAEVRVLNPGSGSTYHPKVYLGRTGRRLSAVVGSANLTGGLATNVEVGVVLRGTIDDAPLAKLWEWAEEMWRDDRHRPFLPPAADGPGDDEFEPELLNLIEAARRRDPVFLTLRTGARNLVTEVTRSELLVETFRSRKERGGSSSIPAWMFNLAWDWLRSHGELTNSTLLEDLRVHRSSAVCAVLARLDGIEPLAGRVGVRVSEARQAR